MPATSPVSPAAPPPGRILVVGAGRMGHALVSALRAGGADVLGPGPRGATGVDAATVLLAVPDAAIADAAAMIAPGPLVGPVSGSLGLEPLHPHESFSLHPLMTVADAGATFAGVTAAVDGTSARARERAEGLARSLGMTAVHVRPADRTAYHAAASIAANFLVTLEDVAEQLAATAGIPRQALAPLVRAAVENWLSAGGRSALTGPVSRGDHGTVARQRAAVAERLPAQLPLFDALVTATELLARRQNAEVRP